MTRAEHIADLKQRALEVVGAGDLSGALASYLSDLGKHPEADPSRTVRERVVNLHRAGRLATAQQVTDFIEGTI